MKNFVQEGNIIDIVGPEGGLTGGEPYMIGGISLIPCKDLAEGEPGVAKKTGVYRVDVTATTALSAGGKVYYTAANETKLSTEDAGEFFGYSLVDLASGTANIKVLLK